MPSLLKRISESLKKNKTKNIDPVILNVTRNECDQNDVTPSSSNITSITSLGNPTLNLKSKSSINRHFINNNSGSEKYNDLWKMGDNGNEISVINCISGFSKDLYSNDTIKSFIKNETEFDNQNSSSNLKDDDYNANIKVKLMADHENLLQKNQKIKKRYEKSKNLNDFLKSQLTELENFNKKLVADNAEILHEAIKHRFLKLESEDLSKKTNQYKQKLEEKENLIVKFQKQFENIRMKSSEAFKLKEEAQLEASHSNVKLKELANDCAELGMYRNENNQKKFFFNELQNIIGNIRVYLKIKPTVGESCISFLGDDKILLSTTDSKQKSLICQFSHVFQPNTNNKDIYEEFEPLLANVVDGYNCCFINYGQVCSGKSLTLFGEDMNPGILTKTLNYFLATVEENRSSTNTISLSAIHINKNLVFDLFRKKPVNIIDDGKNLILKNTDEQIVSNMEQCSEIIGQLKINKDLFKPIASSQRSFSHLLVIIRFTSVCKLTQEKSCGIAMFCELAGFENENNLKFSEREYLKEEKYIQESLIDLGKTLVSLKGKLKKKPRPMTILTKLLQPCLIRNSKCCLTIHCLSDTEEQYAITKSIQYGLAIMPKIKNEQSKYIVQWDFGDEK